MSDHLGLKLFNFYCCPYSQVGSKYIMSPEQVLRTARVAKTEMGQPVHCCILMSPKALMKLVGNGARTRGDQSTDRYRQVRAIQTL